MSPSEGSPGGGGSVPADGGATGSLTGRSAVPRAIPAPVRTVTVTWPGSRPVSVKRR